jgi:hypothetical protein
MDNFYDPLTKVTIKSKKIFKIERTQREYHGHTCNPIFGNFDPIIVINDAQNNGEVNVSQTGQENAIPGSQNTFENSHQD